MISRTVLFPITFLLVCTGILAGGDATDDFPLVTVPLVKSSPVIDGTIDKARWNRSTGSALMANHRNGPMTEPAKFRVMRDGNFIYFRIEVGQRFLDPALNNLKKASCTIGFRDGPVYNDDSIEVFLCPDDSNYFQIAVNSDGCVYDARNKDSSFDVGGLKVAVQKGDRSWCAEIAIPFAGLGLTSGPGERDMWRCNVYRNNPATGEAAAWSPTQGGFHALDLFGVLSFARASSLIRGEVIDIQRKSMKIYSAGPVSGLCLTGVQSGVDLAADADTEVFFHSDGSGSAQIGVKGEAGCIFRTSKFIMKSHETNWNVDLKSRDGEIEFYVNGERKFSGGNTVSVGGRTGFERVVAAIRVSGASDSLSGCLRVSGTEIPVSDFVYSLDPPPGWEKTGFDDGAWSVYDGRSAANIALRYTVISSHTIFAPQLDEDYYYMANLSAAKMAVRLSSPFPWPVKKYIFHLDLPMDMRIPVYRPDRRRYNRCSHRLSERVLDGRRCYEFTFDQPVERLGYNFGYNLISFIAEACFPAGREGGLAPMRVWMSCVGARELPREISVRIMPPLDGRQPRRINVIGSAEHRGICYSGEESGSLIPTWKACGYTAMWTGVQSGAGDGNSYSGLNDFRIALNRHGMKCIYQTFAHAGTFEFSDIHRDFPFARMTLAPGVEGGWHRLLCPYYFINSPDIARRLVSGASGSDAILIDVEWGSKYSCYCDRCRALFAAEEGIDHVPDVAEISRGFNKAWTSWLVKLNRKIVAHIADAARSLREDHVVAVYSGHATQPPDKYGMNWRLYSSGVDWRMAGYDENADAIAKTRGQLNGGAVMPGIFLDSNYWETSYAKQFITARLWLQLIRGGFSGLPICTWEEMDGRGQHSLAEFTRGVSMAEDFLIEANQIPPDFLFAGCRRDLDFVYRCGESMLCVLINPSNVERHMKIAPLASTWSFRDALDGHLEGVLDGRPLRVPSNGVRLLLIEKPLTADR